MNETHAQELGRLAADVENLRRDEARLMEGLVRIEARLTEIEKTLENAQGGWRMLMAVGGVAGTVGAGLASMYQWAKGH